MRVHSVYLSGFWATLLAGAGIALLSACSLGEPSRLNLRPIGVVHGVKDQQVSAVAVDRGMAAALADDYRRYGNGPMTVTVTYEPSTGEARAKNEVRRISNLLSAQGVKAVDSSVLPVVSGAGTLQVLIHYEQIVAEAPAACSSHISDDRAQIFTNKDGTMPDYRFGCGVDTYLARQVARPRDLLGSDKIAPAEGGRLGTRLQDYRDGKDYKDLKAQNASETQL